MISAPNKSNSITSDMLPAHLQSRQGGKSAVNISTTTTGAANYITVNAGEAITKGDRLYINTYSSALKSSQHCIGLAMNDAAMNTSVQIQFIGEFDFETSLFSGKIGLELFSANGVLQTKPFTNVSSIHYLQSLGFITSNSKISLDLRQTDYIV